MRIEDLENFESGTLLRVVERRALAGEPDAVLGIMATHTAITTAKPQKQKETRRVRR